MSIVHFLLISVVSCNVFASYFDDAISDETQCQCVPPHQCSDNDEAANGQGILDIRFENDACPNHFDVCCDMPLSSPPPPPPPQKCGLSTAGQFGVRITSDSEKTEIGELPWTVLVFDSAASKERNSFICGGALIHPQVVLTAAHCVAATKSVRVRAGEWNIRNKDEPLPHQDESVKEVLLHPQYKPGTLWNDVALLVLNQAFAVTENVGFICLPAGKFKIDEEKCVASGWGRRGFGRKRLSPVLRKVTLPLVGRGSCQRSLRGTRLGKAFRLHKSFICAGGTKNKDTCKGDGGSPLICPIVGENGRYVQVGVVSWGIGCGGSTPGVYSNVRAFGGWIEEQMNKNNFSTEYYTL